MRTSFNFNRKGVSADYARRIRDRSPSTGRYTFDYTKLFDEQIQPEDQLLIDRLFPQVKLSKFFGAVLRDSRDDVLDPQTRGGRRHRRRRWPRRSSGRKSASSRPSCRGFSIAGCPGAAWCWRPVRGSASPSAFRSRCRR